MIKDEVQKIQDEEYAFPYHYVSQYKGNFTQNFNDPWGINYVATIEFLLTQLEKEPVHSIVDVGCGDGRFTYELRQKFPTKFIWGIDYSERAIQLAKAMNPEGNYVQCDITTTPFPHTFDAAILMEVLEHIPPPNARSFLHSIARLLNPSGILYITVPHQNKPIEYKHYRHFSAETLTKLVSDFFEVKDVVFFEKIDWRKNILDKVLTNQFFILHHAGLLNRLYKYYKTHLFHVTTESQCKRLFVKLICR